MKNSKSSVVKILSVNNLSVLSDSIKNQLVKRIKAEHPEYVDVTNFFWLNNTLFYSGKLGLKKIKKTPIGKSETMSDNEYINNVVLKNNKTFAKEWNEMNGSKIEWKPVIISNANEKQIGYFSQRYLISKEGVILQIDDKNCLDCIIKHPYFDKGTKSFHIDLVNPDGKNSKDNRNYHRNQQVRTLVETVWGTDASLAIKEQEDKIAEKAA